MRGKERAGLRLFFFFMEKKKKENPAREEKRRTEPSVGPGWPTVLLYFSSLRPLKGRPPERKGNTFWWGRGKRREPPLCSLLVPEHNENCSGTYLSRLFPMEKERASPTNTWIGWWWAV